MIFPGHLGAGFLTGYAVIKLMHGSTSLSTEEINILLGAGTLLGVAPDSDIIFYFFQKKTLKPEQLSAHRKYLTHAPLVWLIVGGTFFAVSYIFHLGTFWKILSLLLWLCPWSHFICDSLDTGIMWLWPFSTRQYALYNSQSTLDANNTPPPANWRTLFGSYLKNPSAYIELCVAFFALYTAFVYFL